MWGRIGTYTLSDCAAALAAYPGFFNVDRKEFFDFQGVNRTVTVPTSSKNFTIWMDRSWVEAHPLDMQMALWVLEYTAAMFHMRLNLDFGYVLYRPENRPLQTHTIQVYYSYSMYGGVALPGGAVVTGIVQGFKVERKDVATDWDYGSIDAHELYHLVQRFIPYNPPFMAGHEGTANFAQYAVYFDTDPMKTYEQIAYRHLDVRLGHAAYEKWWYWGCLFKAIGLGFWGKFCSDPNLTEIDAIKRAAQLLQLYVPTLITGSGPTDLMRWWCRNYVSAMLNFMVAANNKRALHLVPPSIWTKGLALYWNGFVYLDWTKVTGPVWMFIDENHSISSVRVCMGSVNDAGAITTRIVYSTASFTIPAAPIGSVHCFVGITCWKDHEYDYAKRPQGTLGPTVTFKPLFTADMLTSIAAAEETYEYTIFDAAPTTYDYGNLVPKAGPAPQE